LQNGGIYSTVLPKFQEFLKTRKIVPDNQAPFYARWASKFLSFNNGKVHLPLDVRIDLFVKNAEHAIKIGGTSSE